MADNLGSITRGDDEVIPLSVTNPDNSIRNISGDSFIFTMKRSKYDTTPLVQKTSAGGGGIVKTNTAGGLLEVTIDQDDLLVIDREQRYHAEVEVTDSGGKKATTPFTVDFQLDLA
jgi:hypothetical protein